jgi:hypothetical protein
MLTGVNLAMVTSAHVIAFTAREEQLADTPMAHLVMDVRDRTLLAELVRLHEQRCREPITVGVVYGAAHMPAAANGLMDRYRYRPRKAEWMTVFLPH